MNMKKTQVIKWLKDREFNTIKVWDNLLTWLDIIEAIENWIFHYTFVEKIIIARSK